ncbi:MAG: 2-oxo acid dehydrogenase subunit E2 [Xanthomonadales bacterium]|nr:2-oxo acid dehydrogenase subunit E2 [Xanthomonadales bacterium]
MKTFILPDLGEGLPDAEIVEWHVKEGDLVKLDAPLVSMETAKAVVEVPSPYTGTVVKLFGGPGDVIATGSPLAGFELAEGAAQRAEAEDTGHHHAGPAGHKGAGRPVPNEASRDDGDATTVVASDVGGEILEDDLPAPAGKAGGDAGTVVGAMESSDRVQSERVATVGGVKAMPAVRALAKKLGVDLARVRATGSGGVVTLADVKQAAADGSARAGAPVPAAAPAAARPAAPTTAPDSGGGARERTTMSAAGRPVRTSPPGDTPRTGQPEPLRGVRRNMARIMAQAHAEVVATTLCDDADLHAWPARTDVTARLIRAIVVACRTEPALNAWFDGAAGTRTLHPHVDVGIAVDTPEGLFVPALRNADLLDAGQVREAVNRLRGQVEDRSLPPEDLKGYTISLSNFGVFAGRYATPIVVPPCVAIVAAGKARFEMRPVVGGFEAHRMMPISLTFDHRACTGGEASRFLKALLDDLQSAS